ncbi:MAG: 30S ribosomal protein S20 [Marinimicrobia bacterium 46_47]|nr:MAG: 30S ribosomal protein S20 [Marinimicrobia bacterium 46_47]KUK93502.1 MAG: 30S ribosomal protein S20 [Marinimicrobia bacterium 46_43]HBY17736.1 30S ribosomal protein S20 [Candidatus Neomarinimicrobiota bacterium]
MAYPLSTKKRIRQAEKSNRRNRHYKSLVRTEIKKFMATESRESGQEKLKKIYSLVDKVAQKGILHKNRAADIKSRLSRHLNTLN